jgi:hypothetical protein
MNRRTKNPDNCGDATTVGEPYLLFADACGQAIRRPEAPGLPPISAGASVQINALLATRDGNLTYVYMQRGIVDSLNSQSAWVRIIAAPPHYPYLHPLHAETVEVRIAALKPAPIPTLCPAS